MATLRASLVVGFVAILGAMGWLFFVYPYARPTGTGREITLSLGPQSTTETITEELQRANILRYPQIFSLYVKAMGATSQLRRGHAVISDTMSPRDMLRSIAKGFGRVTVRVTIPEGFNRFTIAERLDSRGVCASSDFIATTEDIAFLRSLSLTGSNAEGYLFPDTYDMYVDMPCREVIRKMIEHWRAKVLSLFETHGRAMSELRSRLGFGLYEVIILASIVEKEAREPSERPIIAGVFVNRLASPTFKPKRLQTDPSIPYGCLAKKPTPRSCENVQSSKSITKAMLADATNPYNTYVIEGLPPSPISSPSLSSIVSVLEYSKHRYFYFVASGHGRHTFSETLKDHTKAVDRAMP